MSLGIYLIPIFVTGSIYLFILTKDFIQNKKNNYERSQE